MALSATLARFASLVNGRLLATIGIFLIVAAALKGHQFVYSGVPFTSAVRSVPFYVALVSIEFLLGAWLINGLHARASRIGAWLWFFGLFNVAIWMALTGRPSCGCLGDLLEVNPWWAVGFDLAVLLALICLPAHVPERTVRSHSLIFCRFLVLTSALAIPGVITMVLFAREDLGRHSLRHDPTVNDVKTTIAERTPAARDLLDLVARETDTELTVEADLKELFLTSQPNWRKYRGESRRCSLILEAIAGAMPVRCRWVKTWDGYMLVRDDPWQRSRNYWIGGLVFGVVGTVLLFWGSHTRVFAA